MNFTILNFLKFIKQALFASLMVRNNDSQITNNPVEGWFSHLKNNILQKRKFFERYSEKKDILDDKKEKLTKKEKELEEKWIDKNSKVKREKGFYYQNLPNFNIDDEDYGFPLSNSFQSLDFDLLFESLND
ncbi:hypothetical protein BpHYR1_029415, partial [Brachionus plicatilis]